ncbi:uncharacterized protein LOC119405905 [Rhipicephalus sanguineus]|uniref:uncharacterized protein LOC119405905 n=1 Tax=Rhipicephalus sanguineus TaxID=34632 RepID=UPI00189470DB|nr:uncharacterized protein LOC119405905 [Rhipicephalus sanguineus]
MPDNFPEVQLHANFAATTREGFHRASQDRKLQALRPDVSQDAQDVINLSSYTPSEKEAEVLSRGLNFNTDAQPRPRDVICAVERAVSHLPSSVREEARTRAIGVLSGLRKCGTKTFSSVAEKQAIRSLRSNRSIAILPSDKGNATVLLDKNDYHEKMLALLGDRHTYAAIAYDPTSRLQTKLQKLLASLFRLVPPHHAGLYHRLLCTNGSAPAMYGLPKVHKPGVPLRPIVDFTRSLLCRLSGYLHQVLSPLAGKTSTHIENSSALVAKLKDVTLSEDDAMVSFDVTSLFTSVPVDLAVATCEEALKADSGLPGRTPFDIPELSELLQFCLSNTYFSYDGKIYQQTHGTAMGASISVTTANLVMEALEGKVLATFTPAPKVFYRYVDDCFCILKKQDIQRFLDCLNAQNVNIQFTVEHEDDNVLPFLDVQFVRDRLVVEIKDKQLSARFQLDAELTLQKALDSVRQIESVRQQQAELLQEAPCLNKVASGA